jgi:hypothetical protein
MEHINLGSLIYHRVKALIEHAKRHCKLQITLKNNNHVLAVDQSIFPSRGSMRNYLQSDSLRQPYLIVEQTVENVL